MSRWKMGVGELLVAPVAAADVAERIGKMLAAGQCVSLGLSTAFRPPPREVARRSRQSLTLPDKHDPACGRAEDVQLLVVTRRWSAVAGVMFCEAGHAIPSQLQEPNNRADDAPHTRPESN
jgi:hypothetical protein